MSTFAASSTSSLCDHTLPAYSSSSSSGMPPPSPSPLGSGAGANSKRESIWQIIASYALPTAPPASPKPTPVAPFGPPSSSAQRKGRRAAPPPALRLFPRNSTGMTKAVGVHYPPSPWKTVDDKPVKWKWSAPVGGEEEGVIVGSEGAGREDVFETIEVIERGAREKGVSANHHVVWEPQLDGSRWQLRTIIGLGQTLAVLACVITLLLVLLSPVSTLHSAGLLVLSFADDRVVTLGALGACFSDLDASAQNCTGTSITPSFGAVYSASSIPTTTASRLPYSFPIFPTALVLSIVTLSATLILLIALNFPRRKGAPTTPLRRQLSLLAAGLTAIAFALGLSATIAQWSSLNGVIDAMDYKSSGPLSAVEMGSAFSWLWAVWSLVGLTLVGWGVMGVEKEEQDAGEERGKSIV